MGSFRYTFVILLKFGGGKGLEEAMLNIREFGGPQKNIKGHLVPLSFQGLRLSCAIVSPGLTTSRHRTHYCPNSSVHLMAAHKQAVERKGAEVEAWPSRHWLQPWMSPRAI